MADEHAPTKYLALEPREASILDIFRVLRYGDVDDKTFIESPKVKQAIVEQKRIIGLSMLAQKVLQYSKKPCSAFGSRFEMCLNIVGNKANFALFVKNLFLRAKVVRPSEKSVDFLSTCGHLDNRVELDKNIDPGSNKYFAALCAMASKLAYENNEFIKATVEKTWKMELLGQGAYNFWNEGLETNSTQAFMFRDKNTNPDMIILAFRGTEPFNADDMSSDCDISWYKLPGIKGRVHRGFIRALGLKLDGTWPKSTKTGNYEHAYNTLTEEIRGQFKINPGTKLIVTGHSLGGALAVLFPAALALHDETEILARLEAVYTFGQPKVGDEKFGNFMKEQFGHYGVRYYRFVYSYDIVPRLPFDNSELMFKHFGTCIYVDSLYEAEVFEEEPLKNYCAWGSFVTKRVNAAWELVRGFVLPHMFAPEYKEGLLQIMFRLFGLIFPGLSAHAPRDYINATRLAIY